VLEPSQSGFDPAKLFHGPVIEDPIVDRRDH
jgi:hypothetical protein